LEPLVELFQRAFSADGVAKEHRQKIDHLIAAKTLACEADLLINLGFERRAYEDTC
jgi:hypothetical protein